MLRKMAKPPAVDSPSSHVNLMEVAFRRTDAITDLDDVKRPAPAIDWSIFSLELITT
jgi:hypothetical protein